MTRPVCLSCIGYLSGDRCFCLWRSNLVDTRYIYVDTGIIAMFPSEESKSLM